MDLKENKYWKLFFIYYAFTCIVIPYDFYTNQAEITELSIIELIFIIFGTYGLYGFIYKKPLINKLFWQIFCLPFIASLSYSFFNIVSSDFEIYISAQVVAFLIAALLTVPFMYAMVKYAYFNSATWVSNK